MKKVLNICFLLLLMMPMAVLAQGRKSLSPDDRAAVKSQIDEMRKNVYTRVLVLSDDEAQKFWPVFDQMQTELEAVKKEMNQTRRNMVANYATMSDADMEKSLDKLMDLEQKTLDIRRKYMEEFKKVLPIKKVALIPRAEREFKKELIDKIKEYKDSEDQ